MEVYPTQRQALFSAHAEVFPSSAKKSSPSLSLLRTRGGISFCLAPLMSAVISSPHTRRYFRLTQLIAKKLQLFSAHAEVFPSYPAHRQEAAALLRTRGGISDVLAWLSNGEISSPHTRRYFPVRPAGRSVGSLFSAHAEVFPTPSSSTSTAKTLLRTRGGISYSYGGRVCGNRSSPHTRRYFQQWLNSPPLRALFSAHAEVFPWSAWKSPTTPTLLRTRGGISFVSLSLSPTSVSSPHTRRYFLEREVRQAKRDLFSAHAEVFPNNRLIVQHISTLLRTRGGISCSPQCLPFQGSSSPHTRRYFHVARLPTGGAFLFSAHAEVFPCRWGNLRTLRLFSAHAEVFPRPAQSE